MTEVTRDVRAKPIGRAQLGVENQSLVFSVFEEDMKLTVNDAVELVAKKCEADGIRPLNSRTVRRAIESLVRTGFLITAGRQPQSSAILYSKQSTKMADDTNIVPLGSQLVSVEKFLELFTAPGDPYKVKAKTSLLTDERIAELKKFFLFSVISSGEPGHADSLQKVNKSLYNYARELQYTLDLINGLLDSPIWFEQYRDRMGYLMRRAQQNNPELFQLAVDVIKGG